MYLLLGKYFSLHLTEQETEDERSQVIKVYLFMLYAGPHRSVVKDSPVEHHSPVSSWTSATMSQWVLGDLPHSKSRKVTTSQRYTVQLHPGPTLHLHIWLLMPDRAQELSRVSINHQHIPIQSIHPNSSAHTAVKLHHHRLWACRLPRGTQ